jgi:adenosylhomocysteine nucleosidase
VNGTLILTAVELEAAGLARELELPALSDLPYRAFGRGTTRIVPVGLGAVLLLERWATGVAGLGAPLVISAGVCGGLDPRLAAGDLVVPARVLASDGTPLAVASGAHARALRCAGGEAVEAGTLATVAAILATPADKAALRAASGAAAVDMESAPILAAARAAGLDALVVRGVSDDAGASVPAALSGLVSREGRVRGGRVLLLALTQPQTLPQALALRRGGRRALAAVARVLAGLLTAP